MHSNTRARRGSLRRPAIIGAGLALALTMAGCAPAGDAPQATGEIREGGTLNIGISGEPGSLDPTMSNTLTSSGIFAAMCEKLYEASSDGTIVPKLATERVVFNDDHTVATIKLREGATFQDGTPFNAEAAKFSLDRHKTAQGSQRSNELDAVKEVVVVDDSTIDLHLNYPVAEGAFYVNISSRSGIMVSPTAVQELGDDAYAESPVCVGPFKFESRVAQDNVTLVKDDNYYDVDKVHLDSLVYRVIPDTSIRATNLRSGDLDVIERVATVDVATLEADPKLAIHRFDGLGHYNLIFNMGNVAGSTGEAGQVDTPLAKDARIRQALELSIDREAINKVVFNGEFGPACGFMAPSSEFASDETQSCSKYDPDRAKKLMEEAGVETPFKVEILMNQTPDFRRMAEMIQQMAAPAGFDIEINVQESTATIQAGQSGNFQVYVNSWSGGIDPDYNISRFAQSTSPASLGKYNNPEVDRLLKEARSAVNPDDRTKAYAEIDAHLKEDVPFIYLIRPVNLYAHQANLVGLDYRGEGLLAPAFAGFIDQ